jgi:hypothetical protein
VKKRYFFGHLFVRAARGLAVLVLLAGIGFCLLQYSQARIAADSAAYQPSPVLQQAVEKLAGAFSSTEQIVSSFSVEDQPAAPKVQVLRFPPVINSNEDFVRVDAELSKVDQERQQLKQSIVSRFESLVKGIEEKLRAYAQGLRFSPATDPSPVQSAVLSPLPTSRQESLFSPKLQTSETNERRANLTHGKEFLEMLGTKAENADNRARLKEAAVQLELLGKLLPEKLETPLSALLDPGSTPSNQTSSEPTRKPALSERVADELEHLRREVRQMLLTSWTLDDSFEQANGINFVERDKCRVATLAQEGIWLSGVSRMLIGVLTAVLVSFLILAYADLLQTQLGLATNTEVVADAIRALRGLAISTSQSESGPS